MQRRKYRRGKSKLASKIWKIGIGVLTLFIVLDVYLLATSRFFNVKSVEVVLDKVKCTDENNIKNELSILGKNFFKINRQDVENKIRNKYFCIKSVSLYKTSPNKVKVEVFGREAVAIISLLKSSESTPSANLESIASFSATFSKDQISDEYLVDSDGIIFSNADQSDTPRLFFSGKLSIGKKIEEKKIENSLDILKKLKSFDLNIRDSIIYPDGTFLLNLTSGKPRIIFNLEKNVEVQLASLQLILIQAKIEEQDMEFIDLRYDKPIVKYVSKKK